MADPESPPLSKKPRFEAHSNEQGSPSASWEEMNFEQVRPHMK